MRPWRGAPVRAATAGTTSSGASRRRSSVRAASFAVRERVAPTSAEVATISARSTRRSCQPIRGNRFHQADLEAMSSAFGTHCLRLAAVEPIASGSQRSGPERGAGVLVFVVDAAVAVWADERRLRVRRRQGAVLRRLAAETGRAGGRERGGQGGWV